ncbi:MAG: nodulation protein NodJ [Gammaproteobacteria bacterium]|nr:MAG: nodulation protein NodJ [Gammaproteobacteria bacterium]RLA20373.1 MAG: nodulation protein NodJ [Gammaproteobacteria bacterium]
MMETAALFSRSSSVWMRNAQVWSKLAGSSLLGSFAEPLFYLFALGYGLGQFIGSVEGVSYIVFLASGILSTSAMNTATFEGLYLAYTRMEVQRTWDGMLSTPLGVTDIVLGEVMWMGTKSVISAIAILLVTALSGFVESVSALWVLPIAFLTGCCFGSVALTVTALSRSYDFFMYYLSLVVTPMVLLSGVFFPLASLPETVQGLVAFLPLYHVVEMVRPLMTGGVPGSLLLHLFVPAVYCLFFISLAISLLKRRLLN